MRHNTILEYQHYRYLKAACMLVALAIMAYLLHQPAVGPYGGTWLGYTLGTIAALLVGGLTWFGVRKRRYNNAPGTLQGWLSAHVYLGASLIVIATLHTGFEFGWNVHTLAYALMLMVIFSGFYGIFAYLRYPRFMTDNMGEETLDTMFLKLADLDNEARTVSLPLPDEICALVRRASQKTRIGGNVIQQLRGTQRNCPTDNAVEQTQVLGSKLKGEQAKANRDLYAILLRRKNLVKRMRRDIKLKARLEIWLYVHVPLSIGLLAALAAHVVSVFFYW